MSNIHGLGSVKKAGPVDKANEEFSVGGAQSGQAVLRPVKGGGGGGGGSGDPMADIINAAKNQSGNPVAHDRNLGLITIYSNGFQVGNAAFRDSKEAKNKQFLDDLKAGVVPKELEPEMRKEWPDAKEVGIQLVNKSTQTYVPPKAPPPKYDFKASTGQSLTGSGSGSGAAAASASGGAAASGAFSAAKPKLHVADESQPTTDIHISSINKFELIGGGGIPKPLTNPNATLKDANLLASSFSQRVAPSSTATHGSGASGRAGAKK